MPETELTIGFRDSPDFGRRYDVFHGQVRLGKLEVSPLLYNAEKPQVLASIELDMVRLLSFDDVAGFLSGIALHVTDNIPSSQEYSKAQQSIQGALTKALWQTQKISEFYIEGAEDWGELALQLCGSPSWYFGRRDCQAFRENREAVENF